MISVVTRHLFKVKHAGGITDVESYRKPIMQRAGLKYEECWLARGKAPSTTLNEAVVHTVFGVCKKHAESNNTA